MNAVKGRCYFSKGITRLIVIIVSFFALWDAKGQDSLQMDLLREACVKNSNGLLFEFFDHWSEKVQSNEGEAKDPYIAEAHQVFKAFYQSLKLKEIGYGSDMYDDSPYFIVQGRLRKISLAEQIVIPEEVDSFLVARIRQKFQGDDSKLKEWIDAVKDPDNDYKPFYDREGWWPPFFNISVMTIDSAIEFRPNVQFNDKKTVYLTEEYIRLLNQFCSEDPAFKLDTIDESFIENFNFLLRSEKLKFLRKAAYVIPGHWGGVQYVTFPIADQIIFNPDTTRAVVQWECYYHGGDAVLMNQDGEWIIVDCRRIWIE